MNGMNRRMHRFYRSREHRGLAAAVALIALVMQMAAPYLPMPAMGGMTSWDMAALELCSPSAGGADGKAPAHAPAQHDCAVCAVVQQAGGTMAPADFVLPFSLAYLQLDREIPGDPQTSGLSARVFASRAPPLSA